MIVKPQTGPQEAFLSSAADIAIYGGAAGGGKTFSLLLEPLRHLENPKFRGVIFRRTTPQIRNSGGLWDEASSLYSQMGLGGRDTFLDWSAQSGWHLKFSHLEREADKFNWQGSQICFLGFDELTHFSEDQFFYLQSRLRSMSGIRGYVRATCNPDSESWIAKFIGWWIDPTTGFAIPGRSGKIRWFVRHNGSLEWGDTSEELLQRFGAEQIPKSVTFVSANVFDNKLLLQKDPSYLSNLMALPLVERERLFSGNWKIRPSSGLYFKPEYFEIIDATPAIEFKVRYWDRAATPENGLNDPDFTVGILMSYSTSGYFIIEDVVRFRGSPFLVQETIKNTAISDGRDVIIGLAQDPGQAGKAEASYLARYLAGFDVRIYPETKAKIVRAQPVSAQSEAGNVKILRAKWNEILSRELLLFPEGAHDDQVDALSGAFQMIEERLNYSELTSREFCYHLHC